VLIPVRYLIAIPIALLAAALVTFPVHWLVLLVNSCQPDGIVSEAGECSKGLWSIVDAETLERLGYAAFTPATFIYTAASILPNRSKWVPPIFAVLWLSVVVTTLVWTTSDNYQIISGRKLDYSGWGWVEFVFVVLFQFLSSGITAVLMFKERSKMKKSQTHQPSF